MASILELSQPAAEPLSVDEAISFLRRPADTPDRADIQALIPAARRYLEKMTGHMLAQRKFVQYEERFPFTVWPGYFQQSRAPVATRQDHRVRLLRTPLASFQKLVYVGADAKLHAMLPGKDFVVDYAARPSSINPLPGNDWPPLLPGQFWPEQFWLTESWAPGVNGLNRVALYYTAGFTPNANDTIDVVVGADWQPLETYSQYSYLIDDSGNIQLQLNATGLTGQDEPTFAAKAGDTTADGTCLWLNCGPAAALLPYQVNNVYVAGSIVIDPNNNLEYTQAGLTSGAQPPAWPGPEIGTVTEDNGGQWVCLGQLLPGPAQPNQYTYPGQAGPAQIVEYSGIIGLPEDLKMAMKLMVSHFFYNREPVAGGSRDSAAVIVPHSVQQICDNYYFGSQDFGPVAP